MFSQGAWVSVAVALGATACADARKTQREIVLEKIPAGVTAVVVAEGKALAGVRMRQVVDVLRPELPSSVGCAIDAALACDELALGIGRDHSLTLVVATRADVKCPALSQVANGLWVATLGGGGIADASAVLADDAFARARRYLASAPIAMAMAFDGGELIATARPDPLEAWLALDTSPALAPQLETALRAQLARMGSEPTTSPLAAHVEIVRTGPQVVARLARAADFDLAAAVRTLRAWSRRPQPRPAVALACPPLGELVTACSDANAQLVVTTKSAQQAVALLVAARCSPVVQNQSVRGLRLEADVPALGLRAGDVIVGSAGRLVTSKALLVEALSREAAGGGTSLTIRRGILERVVRIETARKE